MAGASVLAAVCLVPPRHLQLRDSAVHSYIGGGYHLDYFAGGVPVPSGCFATNASSSSEVALFRQRRGAPPSWARAFRPLCGATAVSEFHTSGARFAAVTMPAAEYETCVAAVRRIADKHRPLRIPARRVAPKRPGGGVPKAEPYNDAAKKAVVASVAAAYDTYTSRLNTLTNFGTRYAGTSGNKQAGEWVAAQFQAMGAATVTRQPFSSNGKACSNVIATFPGTDPSLGWALLGGHFDSTAESSKRATNAPGAVDDGSGTAAVLTLAQAVTQWGAGKRGLVAAAFDCEEIGLFGSHHFVTTPEAAGVENALIFDMVAYGSVGVKVEGTPAYVPLMEFVEESFTSYSPGTPVTVLDDSWGSDHVPLQEAGIPAVLLIEQDDVDYPDYHTIADTTANVNPALVKAILAGAAAAITDLVLPTPN